MPRSFLIKKKTAEAAVTAVGFRKGFELSATSSCNEFMSTSDSIPSPVPDHASDDAGLRFRFDSPIETSTDKNGNNTNTLKVKPTSSVLEVSKGTVSSPNTVLPAPRRLTIWSPAADVKAEVDAAAAAEMALKLVAKANGIDREALASLSAMAGLTPRSGVGKCSVHSLFVRLWLLWLTNFGIHDVDDNCAFSDSMLE
jgi:hypothetical protein